MTTILPAESAIVFPGISAVPFDQVSKFMVINPMARRLTAEAESILEYPLVQRHREADGDFSEYARESFLITCLALAEWAAETMDLAPAAVVGPSFGGTPAAVHSGSLTFADAVRLTARWSHRVEAYFAEQHGDVVTQSFARVDGETLALIRAELAELDEWSEIACHVDERFYMLSVRERRLDWLLQRLRSVGGLPLFTMRPPMHSALFGRLRDDIERGVLADLTFTDPKIPVVSDHDGGILTSGAEVREMVLDGIVRAVRWPTALRTLGAMGVRTLYISGPDSLWGRVPCAYDTFEVTQLRPELAMRPRRRVAAV